MRHQLTQCANTKSTHRNPGAVTILPIWEFMASIQQIFIAKFCVLRSDIMHLSLVSYVPHCPALSLRRAMDCDADDAEKCIDV